MSLPKKGKCIFPGTVEWLNPRLNEKLYREKRKEIPKTREKQFHIAPKI